MSFSPQTGSAFLWWGEQCDNVWHVLCLYLYGTCVSLHIIYTISYVFLWSHVYACCLIIRSAILLYACQSCWLVLIIWPYYYYLILSRMLLYNSSFWPVLQMHRLGFHEHDATTIIDHVIEIGKLCAAVYYLYYITVIEQHCVRERERYNCYMGLCTIWISGASNQIAERVKNSCLTYTLNWKINMNAITIVVLF